MRIRKGGFVRCIDLSEWQDMKATITGYYFLPLPPPIFNEIPTGKIGSSRCRTGQYKQIWRIKIYKINGEREEKEEEKRIYFREEKIMRKAAEGNLTPIGKKSSSRHCHH